MYYYNDVFYVMRPQPECHKRHMKHDLPTIDLIMLWVMLIDINYMIYEFHMNTFILQGILIVPNQSLQVKDDHEEPSCKCKYKGIHVHNVQYM